MTGRPTLSVVIPAYNEEAGLSATIGKVVAQLESMRLTWELVVVNDGSADSTAAIVTDWAQREPRVRLLDRPHGGKGAAVKAGMLAATGEWRFLADADLSMPLSHLPRLLELATMPDGAPILIGSREADGSRRVNEPLSRHAIGRLFNLLARVLLVPGVSDTQCGFKLFSGAAADALFPHQRLDGFSFDVEILALARRAGFAVREVPIEWHWAPHSKVTLGSGAHAFFDLFRIRWNLWRGAYVNVRRRGTEPHRKLAGTASVDA